MGTGIGFTQVGLSGSIQGMNSRTPQGMVLDWYWIWNWYWYWYWYWIWMDRDICICMYTVYCTAVLLYYYCNYCKNDFTALIDSLSLTSTFLSSLQRSQQRSD